MALGFLAKNALRTFGLDVGGGILGNAANLGLSAYQNRQNIRMWKLNNAYNSPKAQMQRFVDAGLNPNLIYGQGSSGNSSSPVTFTVPKVDMRGRALDHLSQYMTSLVQDASRRSTEEDIQVKQWEREVIRRNYEMNNMRFAYEMAMKPFELKYNLEGMRLRNEALLEEIGGRRLANQYNRDTYQDRVAAASLANALTFANIGVANNHAYLLGRQGAQANLNYVRDYKYGLQPYLDRNAQLHYGVLMGKHNYNWRGLDKVGKIVDMAGGLISSFIPFGRAGRAGSGASYSGWSPTVSY